MKILRDEDLIYDRVLADNEAGTKLDLNPDMLHIFWSTFPTFTRSRKAALNFINGIRWLDEYTRSWSLAMRGSGSKPLEQTSLNRILG